MSGARPPGRSVAELYGTHPGADIFIVGTGPSLRVFPLDLLAGRITIGLNLAWQLFDVMYGITIHPDLNVPEFLVEPQSRPGIKWVVKRGKVPVENRAEADRRCWYFRTAGKPDSGADVQSDAGRVLDWVRRPTGDHLYLFSSISQPAVNLAANMGARNVFLVGCDNGPLAENHHAHSQHTMWLGTDPLDRYRRYFDGLAEMRPILRERGVNLVSLSPFLSLGPHEHDFALLCKELEKPELIVNDDITDTYRAPAAIGGPEAPSPGAGLAREVRKRAAGGLRRLGGLRRPSGR